MERAGPCPADVVGRDLAKLDGVLRVHDLHVWTLSSGTIALSAHLEIRNLADWPGILAAARQTMEAHHGIRHVTLQPEALAAQPLVRGHHPARPRIPNAKRLYGVDDITYTAPHRQALQ
jgi:cobalt-zinc-cadmium efflux system protein